MGASADDRFDGSEVDAEPLTLRGGGGSDQLLGGAMADTLFGETATTRSKAAPATTS